jgi:Ca-activated chloride channel family protein
VDVIERVLGVWRVNKKSADVVLVMDTSGSMNDQQKLAQARIGANQFVSLMNEADSLSLLPFSTQFNWALENVVLSQAGKATATAKIDSLFATGETSLYDAIREAFDRLRSSRSDGKIQAVVVLTDGADTNSRTQLPELVDRVRVNGESGGIRIFTIAYGGDARKDVLQQIADATQAKSYVGNPQTIVGVFRDVSTFF